MLNKIKKIVSMIDETFFHFSAVIMVIVEVYAVIRRYLLHNPLLWCEEVLMVLILWCVFFGASIAFRDHAHVAVDMIFEMFPKKVQMVLDALIWAFVTYCIVWIGKVQVDRAINLYRKAQTTVVLNFPKYITYGVVAFACLLMLISHIIAGIEDVQKYRAELKGGNKE